MREWYIEIRDLGRPGGSRVVTVIELLSYSNKQPRKAADVFDAKREALLWSEANYVEIDLLRGGRRWPGIADEADYAVAVSLYEDRSQVAVWPWSLRDRLPSVPVPLADSDPPIRVDLQKVLNETCADERYLTRRIHTDSPDPPLPDDDRAWAAERLAAAGVG